MRENNMAMNSSNQSEGYTDVAGELGQGIAEYVIILAVIVVTGIVLVTAFGGQLTGVWNTVTTQFGTLA